ncbi:unnamed protein product [Gordionus sp. m RMFG-2023]
MTKSRKKSRSLIYYENKNTPPKHTRFLQSLIYKIAYNPFRKYSFLKFTFFILLVSCIEVCVIVYSIKGHRWFKSSIFSTLDFRNHGYNRNRCEYHENLYYNVNQRGKIFGESNKAATKKYTLIDIKDFKFITLPIPCAYRATNQKIPWDSDPLFLQEEVYILILIASDPNNLAWREAIRQTWGKFDSNHSWAKVKLLFLLGTRPEIQLFNERRANQNSSIFDFQYIFNHWKTSDETRLKMKERSKFNQEICHESNKYGDLLIGNFFDSYRNLTYKHVMGLLWVTEYCREVDFIIKTDDDIYVNTGDLINLLYLLLNSPKFAYPFPQNYLNNLKNVTNYPQALSLFNDKAQLPSMLICHKYPASLVMRDVRSKWFVNSREYNDTYYPPYCLGTFIIYTLPLAEKLLNISRNFSYFWIDDVHITGTLVRKLNPSIIDWSAFIWKQFTEGNWKLKSSTFNSFNNVINGLLKNTSSKNLKINSSTHFTNRVIFKEIPTFIAFLLPRQEPNMLFRFHEIFAGNDDKEWKIVIS